MNLEQAKDCRTGQPLREHCRADIMEKNSVMIRVTEHDLIY